MRKILPQRRYRVDRLAVTLHDETKRNELLEVVANLPYVKAVQLEEADDPRPAPSMPKNGREHASSTAQTLPVDPLDQEVTFFETQHDQLVAQFLGQYIAMYQGKVVAHEGDLDTLIANVHKTHPAVPVLFRQVQATLPPLLHFRSPRLEKR